MIIVKNIRNKSYRYFVNIFPIDSWDSWSYEILTEDIMSPFFIFYKCPIDVEFESYDAALSDALNVIYS